MKKYFVFFVMVLFLSNYSWGKEAEYHFRKTRWNMTKQEVIKAEGNDYTEGEDGELFYLRTMFGSKMRISYFFVENVLEGSYCGKPDKKSEFDCEAKVDLISKKLTEMYGNPVREPNGESSLPRTWENESTIVKLYTCNNVSRGRLYFESKLFMQQMRKYKGNHNVQMAIVSISGGWLWVSIRNTGSRPFHINPNYFTLIDHEDISHHYRNSEDLLVNVQPGTVANGAIYFVHDDYPKELIFDSPRAGRISRKIPCCMD